MTDRFGWTTRVRWRHVDPSGRLHFAAIFRVFESAEFEFFRFLGYDPVDLHPALPRVHTEADFLAPVRFDDLLHTKVSVEHVGRTSFRLRFDVDRADDVVATGTTTIVQVDHVTGRALPLTAGLELADQLQAHARSEAS